MKDLPYSVLKQDERAYKIMLFREQDGCTFADISKKVEISVSRTIQIYNKLKIRQLQLYINHIAAVLGHDSTSQIREVYDSAYECYQDRVYVCAYLENEYKDILAQYRCGEPGMSKQFIRNLPPFSPQLSEKTIDRVIELRDIENASFAAISKELHITQAKSRRTYDMYYHKRVIELVKTLQGKMKSKEEKDALWNYCFGKYRSSKERYDMLVKGKSVWLHDILNTANEEQKVISTDEKL